jgi:hypothetical protein
MAAWEGYEDVDLRLLHDRHEAERQEEDGDGAENGQADQQHYRGHRFVEREVGESHGPPSVLELMAR